MADVFHFDIVLYWMVNPEVDSRCFVQERLAHGHLNAKRCFCDPGFIGDKLRFLANRVSNTMFNSTYATFGCCSSGVGEDGTCEAELFLLPNNHKPSSLCMNKMIYVFDCGYVSSARSRGIIVSSIVPRIFPGVLRHDDGEYPALSEELLVLYAKRWIHFLVL